MSHSFPFPQRPVVMFVGLMALGALLLRPEPASAAVAEEWVHRYNNVVNGSDDRAAKGVRDAAGDLIVTGTSHSDMLTVKYSGMDGSVLWRRRYKSLTDGNDSVAANAMAVDGNRNVVVTGFARNASGNKDYYTAKYAAADGALLWEKHYNGPAGHDDFATAVEVDSSGNVAVTGSSAGLDSRGFDTIDYYTAKYAGADGTLVWEKRHNSPGNGWDRANALAVDGRGNVVVTGLSYNDQSSGDYYTAKYAAADGALLWEKRYNSPANWSDGARAVAVDGSGNVVVTGVSVGDGESSHYYTAKYAAADGALLWEKGYNGGGQSETRPVAVAVDGSGNVVVTGPSFGGASGYDYFTAKYEAVSGALLWEQRYDGSKNGHDYAFGLAVDGGGNVVVTGSSGRENDFATVKYAATNGAVLWEKRFQGRGIHPDTEGWWSDFAFYSVAADSSGNVVVAGTSDNGRNNDYYTAKYAAADGALLWEKRHDGDSVNASDRPEAVAVDGIGNVVVTGSSQSAAYDGLSDYYTAKYAAADGALLWEMRYAASVGNQGNTWVQALVVDGSGNVVVTGGSYSAALGTNWDYYTAKYAAADGALIWEKRYNGPANGNDWASAVAVDASGNVVVTGESASSGLGQDYYTAKYAALDGALLWERRYNGPANLNDLPRALAVDGSGNVVVAGASASSGLPNTGCCYDYYMAKYAALDGALLWERRYAVPAGDYNSRVEAVALDGSDNVIVTGSIYNVGRDGDYYTAKYAAADGTLLWEKRFNGPANGSDIARGVAVDASNNVVVTGSSNGGASGADYYTAKYAAADGALLWERRYQGQANLDDIAGAVRLDRSGNVVVTGSSATRRSASGGFINDYYTAKYAAADGALLWEARYNGPENGDDYPSSLALGPNGMVVISGSSAGKLDSIVSYDYATVVYRETLPPGAIALIPAGVRLRFTVTAGQSYIIQHSPAVTGPWNTINTQTAPASGPLEYLDTTPLLGTAFYRLGQP